MNLMQIPRRRYTPFFTPIQKLDRLSQALGGKVNVYMKRDDMLALAGGGNKARKLEYLMADALAQGADTIITSGAIQSNHCRLTLAASVVEGMKCHLVLTQYVPGTYDPAASGNNLLYHLLGAEQLHVIDAGVDIPAKMEQVAQELRAQGRKPYIIPGGGSNDIGSLGYVSCVQEMLMQLHDMDVNIDYIVTTSGSAGTHAGLLAGVIGQNAHIPVVGICTNQDKAAQEKGVYDLTLKLARKLGFEQAVKREDVIVIDDYIGEGYSRVTGGMVEAVKLLARTEAILMDPVYTGKAMHGMLDLIEKGYFAQGKNVLFLHTGGGPALFAYTDAFLQD